MKFVLKEDNTALNQEEDYDIYILDGKYYFYDGHSYQPVPKSILGPIIAEKENQDRLKELEDDPTFDKEAEDAKNQERINKIKQSLEGTTVVTGLKDEIADIQNKEKYKRKAQEKAKNQKSKLTRPLINPSFAEIEESIDDFMNNLLDTEPDYDIEIRNRYDRPNPYKELDPRFRMKNRSRFRVEHDDSEDEKPLVLFYFDRSGSFNPYHHAGKTQLGKDLQSLFTKYEEEGKIVVQTLYYSSDVYETEQQALNDGGNNGTALVEDIIKRTKGHIANVVVLGDDDNRPARGLAEVEGAVWLVFCNQYDKTLQTHIRGKGLTKQFFFTNMD